MDTHNYCELCFPNSTFIAELFPYHELIFNEGIYKVVQDHDEIFRFHSEPIPDPWSGMSDEQIDASVHDPAMDKKLEEYIEFSGKFRKENFIFHPQTGHEIVELCMKIGYDPKVDGWLDSWIVDRAASFIRSKEKTL